MSDPLFKVLKVTIKTLIAVLFIMFIIGMFFVTHKSIYRFIAFLSAYTCVGIFWVLTLIFPTEVHNSLPSMFRGKKAFYPNLHRLLSVFWIIFILFLVYLLFNEYNIHIV